MRTSAWLCYEFPGDDRARIALAIPYGDYASLLWAYSVLRGVRLNSRRPDPLGGWWFCEVTP